MTTQLDWTCSKDAIAASSAYGNGQCAHVMVGCEASSSRNRKSALQFSASFPPTWTSVASATLHMRGSTSTTGHDTPDAGYSFDIKRGTANFTEGTTGTEGFYNSNGGGLTWSSFPGSTATNQVTDTWASGLQTWDITNMVNDMIAAGVYVIVLEGNSDNSNEAVWDSRHVGTAANRPFIRVVFNTNTVPAAPTNPTPTGGTLVASRTPTLTFTPSDAEGDTHTAYTYQVDDNSDFSSPFESTEVTGSFANGVPVNRVVTTTLTRGNTYYWRVKTRDAEGYGPYTSGNQFKIMQLPTATLTVPGGDGQAAPVYYTSGSNTDPKFRLTWSYNCPDGHAQTSADLKIYADPAGAALHTHNHSGSATTADITGYVPSNGTAYNPTVQVTCAGGLSSSESSQSDRTVRVRWSRASYYYNMGVNPIVGWGSPTVNATSDATSANVVEYASSKDSTAEPTTWYSSLAAVPLTTGTATTGHYVWHRVTQYAWGSASPTKPAVQDVTLPWTVNALIADNWTTDSHFVVDTATEKFGTQSLKGVPTGLGPWVVYQIVDVQPDTDYILSYYLKSLGDSGGLVRVMEFDLSSTIVSGDSVTATEDWTRHPSSSESLSFNSGARTSVAVVCRIGGANGAAAWFDAIKLEASTIVTPWTPGFVGGGVAVDAGGLQVDAQAGGIFRLRGSAGQPEDIVELGLHGLVFGGTEELYSPSSGILTTSGDLAVIGQLSAGSFAGLYPSPLVYTSGTPTWSKPGGLHHIIVECIGGGGAGGGAVTGAAGEHSKGGGGGSGGYSRALISAAALGATVAVTVGAGGTGVSGAAGNAGADSSFGSHCVGKGGAGGATSATSPATFSGALGGAGGIAGTGDIARPGQPGGWGFGSAALCASGVGAPGPFGGGGQAVSIVSQPVSTAGGAAAANSGGGGGGAGRTGTGAAATGGNGGSGVVIVYEFFGP